LRYTKNDEKDIRTDISKPHWTKIAKANGISAYTGTAKENGNLLELLKTGKLLRA
jgi:hypothetical protein